MHLIQLIACIGLITGGFVLLHISPMDFTEGAVSYTHLDVYKRQVLFHKPPGNDFEVYNDFNGLLVNLYRCVRDKPEELVEALRYVLNAREDFDRIRSCLLYTS